MIPVVYSLFNQKKFREKKVFKIDEELKAMLKNSCHAELANRHAEITDCHAELANRHAELVSASPDSEKANQVRGDNSSLQGGIVCTQIFANQAMEEVLLENLNAVLPDFQYTIVPLAYGKGGKDFKLGNDLV